MSQEYTEDKNIRLTKISNRRRIWEAILLLIGIGAIFLMVSLLSFNPSDPSWSQTTWNEPIKNLGGSIGAWLADILFSAFGLLAYAIPVVVVFGCWNSLRAQKNREYTDFFSLSLRTIGGLALILTSCALADLNFDDIYNFSSGGVIGSLFSKALLPWFNVLGATLALLCVWAIGFTLYTGWSWLTITEKMGAVILGGIGFITNRGQNTLDDDDEDEEEIAQNTVSSTVDSQQQPEHHQPEIAHDHDSDDILFSTPSVLELARQQHTDIEVQQEGIANEVDIPAFSATATDTVVQEIQQPIDTAVTQQVVSEAVNTLSANTTEPTLNLQPYSASQDAIEHYRFEIPEAFLKPEARSTTAPVHTNYEKQTVSEPVVETRTENHRYHDEPERTEPIFSLAPEMASASFANTASSVATMATGAIVTHGAQVKQGIGPELPRPNPVRLPTRRELYGNRIPSQREAELRRREEEVSDTEPETESADVQAQAHLEQALRQQFVETQRERYGYDELEQDIEPEIVTSTSNISNADYYADDNDEPTITDNTFSAQNTLDDEAQADEEHEQQLAAQFRQQLATRYGDDIAVETTDIEDEEDNTPVISSSNSTNYVGYQPQTQHSFAASSAPQIEHTTRDSNSSSDDTFLAISPRDDEEEDYTPTIEPKAPLSPLASYSPADDLLEEDDDEPAFMPAPTSQGVVTPANISPQPKPDQYLAQQQQQQQQLIHPFLMRNDRPLQKPTTPMPSLDLLSSPPEEEEPIDMFELERIAKLIEARLNDYRVKAKVVGISPGPVITRFELELAPGVKAARISNLSRDLARSLSAVAVRIVEVIPGKPYVGLELPNKKRQTVYMRELLDSDKFRDSPSPLTVVLGKDIGGQPVVANLAKMPHLLVAGTTGSGKSVGVNAMIISILYKAKPEDVRFIMIDPKMLELSVYEGIPHLLTEVVTDMKDAASALRWSVAEMERRYKLMSALGVRNLAGYNEKIKEAEAMGRPIPDPFWKPSDSMAPEIPMLEKEPYIVVVVDEFADLMMTAGKKVEELIARLAQKARAAGIHLVLATQRPSVDIITGLIKANIPSRIAFTVSSKIDSRTILDQGGAESLLGMGDMLYAPNGYMPERVHGAFVSDDEVHAVATDWKARGRPQYIEAITKCGEEGEASSGGYDDGDELDPLFDQAVEFVVEKQRVSISGVQRQFRIGYNRAARIVEQMEMQGIVSSPNHNNTRDVLSPPPSDM